MFHFDYETQMTQFRHFMIKNLRRITYPVFPTFSITTIAILWGIFLGSAHSGHYTLHTNSPTLPDNKNYPFKGITDYPDCSNIRDEWGRPFSYQIVHTGLNHIIGNTFAIFIYGSFLENLLSFYSANARFLYCFGVFEMGVFYGALSFSYVYPFDSIVGSSSGVYSLIGSNISAIIIHYDKINFFKWFFAVTVIGVDLLLELVFYFVSYNKTTAYMAHAGGFLFGLLSGLSFGLLDVIRRKIPLAMSGDLTDFEMRRMDLSVAPNNSHINWGALVIGITSLASLTVFTALLFYDYVVVWTPRTLNWNPTFHAGYPPLECCRQKFSMMAKNITGEFIAKEYYCSTDWKLVKYNETG
jgi:membrane associated rhomboid family serine protease